MYSRSAQRRADKLGRHAHALYLTQNAVIAKPLMPQMLGLSAHEECCGLNLYAGSHGRRNRDPVDEMTLSAGWPGLLDRIGESANVLDQLFRAERSLAYPRLNDAGFLGAKFHRAAFGAAHGIGDIHCDRADLRIRH